MFSIFFCCCKERKENDQQYDCRCMSIIILYHSICPGTKQRSHQTISSFGWYIQHYALFSWPVSFRFFLSLFSSDCFQWNRLINNSEQYTYVTNILNHNVCHFTEKISFYARCIYLKPSVVAFSYFGWDNWNGNMERSFNFSTLKKKKFALKRDLISSCKNAWHCIAVVSSDVNPRPYFLLLSLNHDCEHLW